MKTKAQKWGNSLAVRIPRGVAERAGLKAEDLLEVDVVRGKIVFMPARPNERQKYRLDDLVRKISVKNRYKETDFGTPVGREVW